MRKLVPCLAALALLAPSAGTVLAAPTPVQSPIGCATLSQGDTGFPVRVLQGDLAQLGLFNGIVTGAFRRSTSSALKRFQSSQGLSPTGVLNAATLTAIEHSMDIRASGPNCSFGASSGIGSGTTSASASTGSSTTIHGPIGCAILSQGDSGFQVRVLQGDLAQLGFFNGAVTGAFAGTTTTALQRFQSSHGVPATGVLQMATLTAIEQAMGISTASPNCGGSTGGAGSGSSAASAGVSSTGTGKSSGSAAKSTGGSPQSAGGASQGTSASSGSSSSSSQSTLSPLAGIISPTPHIAIDYEYTFITPGFPLSGSCASQSAFGAWDASHGYAGIVLDLGNPLGLKSRDGLAGAESVLRNAENCYTKGFVGVAPRTQPVIYVGFSNDTTNYQQAGTVAAEYVASGSGDVQGTWLDIESDWSTVADVHAMVSGYLSVNPAASGHGQWCDSTYRNYSSGSPNDTWTVSAMLSQYVSPLLNAGYTCLGTQRILIPQAYAASWLTNGSANFSSSSGLAKYVGGITVCGAVESTGSCPDLSIHGGSGSSKWTEYSRSGYLAASSSVVAVVGGGSERIPV